MVHVNFLLETSKCSNASASRSCSLALSVVSSAAFTFSINGATFSPRATAATDTAEPIRKKKRDNFRLKNDSTFNLGIDLVVGDNVQHLV